jgi:hypothetical protein
VLYFSKNALDSPTRSSLPGFTVTHDSDRFALYVPSRQVPGSGAV